jgi:hypothetical protein
MQNSETKSAKSANQPTSPLNREHPASLEVAGSELVDVLASLKARGAIVCGMASVCVSRWRLSIHWPQQPPVGKLEDSFCKVFSK